MSGPPKERLQIAETPETTEHAETETETDARELYLRDGRKVVVTDGAEALVEIRNPAGLLEVRIKLTEEGPVLQLESVRMQLKAAEAVEIASKHVAITASEQVEVAGRQVAIASDEDVDVDAKGEVHVVGKMIFLN